VSDLVRQVGALRRSLRIKVNGPKDLPMATAAQGAPAPANSETPVVMRVTGRIFGSDIRGPSTNEPRC